MIGKVWTTTTQDLADRVLKDSETFTIRTGIGGVAGLQWWMPRILRTLANHMLSMDEPDHKRLRDIVDEAFRRRAVLEMEPRILAIADELAGELFAEGSPADLVERYARKLPLSVICELLGLPLEDRPKFTAWASGFTRFTGTIGLLSLIPNILAMRRYLEKQLKAVREKWWHRSDCRAGAGRKGRWANQPRRDGSDGVSVAVRRARNNHSSDQRFGL